MDKYEIKIKIPDGFELVGTRTDGTVVVVIYEATQNIQQIGFNYLQVCENQEHEGLEEKKK